MKIIDEDALAALEGGDIVHAAAWKFVFPDFEEPGDGVVKWFSGWGEITIEGEVYTGIGEAGLVIPTASSIGGANDGLTIEFSGLDPAITALVDNYDYHQKPVTVYRLVFAPDRKTLLGAAVFMRGRIDSIGEIATVGGKAALVVQVEGPRRDMNRRGARMRSNVDQRALGGDAAKKHVGVAARKTLSWGNKPAASPLGGNGSGGSVGLIRVNRPGFGSLFGA